jgi:hypothetical protein
MNPATLSALAIALTWFAFLPYLRAIARREVEPHLYSWIIWSTTTLTVFAAQLVEGGGAGAWPTGISGVITLWIAFQAWRNRHRTPISRSDRLFLFMAVIALILWALTDEAHWAVIILTLVDLLGFGPTLRKAWHDPHHESALFFGLFALRDLIILLALQHHNLATTLFPATVGTACLAVTLLILWRRRYVAVA